MTARRSAGLAAIGVYGGALAVAGVFAAAGLGSATTTADAATVASTGAGPGSTTGSATRSEPGRAVAPAPSCRPSRVREPRRRRRPDSRGPCPPRPRGPTSRPARPSSHPPGGAARRHAAPVVPVGLHPDGALVIPDDVRQVVGWWTGGAKAGEAFGSVVVAGHVDSARRGIGVLRRVPAARARPGRRARAAAGTQAQRYRIVSRGRGAAGARSRTDRASSASTASPSSCSSPAAEPSTANGTATRTTWSSSRRRCLRRLGRLARRRRRPGTGACVALRPAAAGRGDRRGGPHAGRTAAGTCRPAPAPAVRQARPVAVHQPPRLPAGVRAGAAAGRGADGLLGGLQPAPADLLRERRPDRRRQRGGVPRDRGDRAVRPGPGAGGAGRGAAARAWTSSRWSRPDAGPAPTGCEASVWRVELPGVDAAATPGARRRPSWRAGGSRCSG